LTVTRAGTGTGTVTSSPAAINCGASCSASYAAGTAVTLTATPAAGSTFAGWNGACSGTGACTVTMSSGESVTATFTLAIVGQRLYCGVQHRGLCLGITVKTRFASPGNAVWLFDVYNPNPGKRAADARVLSLLLGNVTRHVRRAGTVSFVFMLKGPKIARLLAKARKEHLTALSVRTTFITRTGRRTTITRTLKVRLS
jgi:hypothetical protein